MNRELYKAYAEQRTKYPGIPPAHALLWARSNLAWLESPFRYCQDRDMVVHKGRRFHVLFDYDTDNELPWDRCEPLGEVRYFRRSDDLPPGWEILSGERHGCWAYNSREARLKEYKRAPHIAPWRAQASVEAEMAYFRTYLADQWTHIGVTVRVVGTDLEESMWGVDTYTYENACQVAEELADSLLHEIERRTYPVTEYGV